MTNDAYLPIPPEVYDWILGRASNHYLPAWSKNCPGCKRLCEKRSLAFVCLLTHMPKVQTIEDWNGIKVVFHRPICFCGEAIDTYREDWETHLMTCPAMEMVKREKAVMEALENMGAQ